MKLTPLENWIMRKAGITERSRDQLEEYQLERIRETLRHAGKSSRFYRGYLDGLHADEIRSFKDFENIPFTFPRQIGDDPLAFLCVSLSEIKRIVTLKSSGTTGADKRVYFTQEDLALTVDFFKFGMSCLVDKGDRVMVLLPGNSFGSIGDLLKKALAFSDIACDIHGVMTDTVETARRIVENGITCVVGIPTQVMRLSRTERTAFQRVKKVLLSTDYVPEALISELTEQFGCSVFTHYGMTEMGYGGGVECEALNGYHMRDADLYFEIVNPENGKPVADGETGEVVFTTLTRKAMPLIRYRTGDIASFSEKPCACGTFLKTMNRVRGRINNKIRIGENSCFSLSELDEIVLPLLKGTDYRASLFRGNRLVLEITAGSDTAYEEIKDDIARSVRKFVFEKFPENMSIEIRRNDHPDPVVNSMVKRMIYDLRASEL